MASEIFHPFPIAVEVLGKTFSGELWHADDHAGLPLIALHGWLDNCKSFSLLAPQLVGRRILAVDMAGHGHTEHRSVDASYHIWDDVREILLLADKMAWPEFGVLGHSKGAAVAAMLAAVAPQRVKKLGLIEGLWPMTVEADEAAEQLSKYITAKPPQVSKRRYDELETFVRARMKGGFGLPEAAARIIVERNLLKHDEGYCWRTDPRLLMPSPQKLTPEAAQSFLEAIQCPGMLVVGDQAMGSRLEELEKRLEHFSHLQIQQAPGGHHLHMEPSVESVVQIFMDFFDT